MHGILEPMIKRLFALLVALAVVSAPVALAVCQITCESKDMQPSMSHGADRHAAHHQAPAEHASCHEVSGAQRQLFPVNGLCDHGTDATPSLVAARNYHTADSLFATVPSVDSISLVRTDTFSFRRKSASVERPGIPLAIPLRV
jgi:hypothetical protein